MVLVLTRSDIAEVLRIDDVIDVVEQAHAALTDGLAVHPDRPNVQIPDSSTLMIPMIAAIGPHRAAGLKLLTDAPDNPSRAAPRQQSTIVMVDPETGRCEAFLDGATITLFRTAAASAVATRHLANPEGGTLGLIGAGAQAHAHLDAILAVRHIERVVVWSRNRSTANRFASEHSERDVRVQVADSPREVVGAADILCTLTPSPHPIVLGDWFHGGLHVNAVGSPPRPAYREIDSAGVTRSRVVVDSFGVALQESGTVLIPLAEGQITEDHFRDELGEVINGSKPGRRDRKDVTLYNSVGLGIQDIATARLVVDAARQKDLGTDVDLTR